MFILSQNNVNIKRNIDLYYINLDVNFFFTNDTIVCVYLFIIFMHTDTKHVLRRT